MIAREEMLGRIRESLGRQGAVNRDAEYDSIPRHYNIGGNADEGAKLELFEERLRDYNAAVHRCAANAVRDTIAAIMSERQKSSLLIPEGIPLEWLPEGREFIRDRGLTYPQMDASEGVLTGCAVAIALTGTIILRHSLEMGRRALTLIPDYHLCVVYADQVVAMPPEGIRQMAGLIPSPLTTISGPSATSDIEMTRVKGVHGPRTLEVILAER